MPNNHGNKLILYALNIIGIADLIVAQNAKQNHWNIYTLDRHFEFIKNILKFQLTD